MKVFEVLAFAVQCAPASDPEPRPLFGPPSGSVKGGAEELLKEGHSIGADRADLLEVLT